MSTPRQPSKLNAVLRLLMIVERRGSHFLDDAQSFDRVLGRGRFAEYQGAHLDEVRCIVESPAYQSCRLRIGSGKTGAQRHDDRLEGQGLAR